MAANPRRTEDDSLSIRRRLPRRASMHQYQPPAGRPSDSETSDLEVSRRSRRFYNKLRRASIKSQKKDKQISTSRSPAPEILAPVVNLDGEAESGNLRQVVSELPLSEHEDRRSETVEVEGSDTLSLRTRVKFRFPFAFFGKKKQLNNKSTTTSGSSYYYSDYTSASSASESSRYTRREIEPTIVLKVFSCHIGGSDSTANSVKLCHESLQYPFVHLALRTRANERRKPFRDASTQVTPNSMKIILILNDREAMSEILREIRSESPWFKNYGHRLEERVEPKSRKSSSRKTRLFPNVHDEKRGMIQGAICIDHWIAPLPHTGGDQLQQLIIYWQHRWPRDSDLLDTTALSMATPSVDIAHDMTNAEAAADGAANSTTETAPERITKPETSLVESARSKSKILSATSGNTEDPRESVFRSNMIIVYERSEMVSRGRTSMVIDNLSNFASTGDILAGISKSVHTQTSLEPSSCLNGVQFVENVIQNVFKSLDEDMEKKVDSHAERCGKLDRRVHKNPEDETVSSELWTYSRQFSNLKKSIIAITFLVQDIRHDMRRVHDTDFLAYILSRLEAHRYDVEEDMLRPVVDMIDLVYKSISIKDSRRSMELNASLWRLSWVTFIFLPLTFLVGFFGMNVDTFADDPSIKWYFIAAAPFMFCVMNSWLLFKYCMDRYSSLKDVRKDINFVYVHVSNRITYLRLQLMRARLLRSVRVFWRAKAPPGSSSGSDMTSVA